MKRLRWLNPSPVDYFALFNPVHNLISSLQRKALFIGLHLQSVDFVHASSWRWNVHCFFLLYQKISEKILSFILVYSFTSGFLAIFVLKQFAIGIFNADLNTIKKDNVLGSNGLLDLQLLAFFLIYFYIEKDIRYL